jgi:virginiamycin B lyase
MRAWAVIALLLVAAVGATSGRTQAEVEIEAFDLPRGTHPLAVLPAADGTVWYTAQYGGALGRLDPASGTIHHIPLGPLSQPHGVVAGPDGGLWVTDGGQNAILRVDPVTLEVQSFALTSQRGPAALNAATFDRDGRLWFTGQSGVYGRLDPGSGAIELFRAPRGPGPHGIVANRDGMLYFVSPTASYLGRIDPASGLAVVLEPPTAAQGARGVWPDSAGRLWISEWHSGQVTVHDPRDDSWQAWRLPGVNPQPYAIWVDEHDRVWMSDFSADAIVRFDPASETFTQFRTARLGTRVRQLQGRPGEVWVPESGTDRLVVLRHR